MRLRTVTAPDARQAMAKLRALLGADAIIVATQTVDDGVRITGAVENDEVDLGVCSPSLSLAVRGTAGAGGGAPRAARRRARSPARRGCAS